jgi:hypothetical protein
LRRQLSNCFAEACGYDSRNRQRGTDADDAPLPVEPCVEEAEVDVVIREIQSNQAKEAELSTPNPATAAHESNETKTSAFVRHATSGVANP